MYVLSYFLDGAESLHLAVSGDGIVWETPDGLNPTLSATPPVRAIRDPFIRQGLDGRYHLLATNGWTSTSIVHATSLDLVAWSPFALVPVMGSVPDARNAWAPEFFVDEAASEHVVIWSSAIQPLEDGWDTFDAISTETHDHRIWSSRTADFRSWSEPKVWFDPGYTVIDASVIRSGDRWVMAFKDERGTNHDPGGHKGVRISGFDHPDGPFDPPSEVISGHLVEGPTMVQTDGCMRMLFDHYLEGRYGGVESSDGTNWVPIENLSVPTGARHASVTRVPEQIFRGLMGGTSVGGAGSKRTPYERRGSK